MIVSESEGINLEKQKQASASVISSSGVFNWKELEEEQDKIFVAGVSFLSSAQEANSYLAARAAIFAFLVGDSTTFHAHAATPSTSFWSELRPNETATFHISTPRPLTE